MTNGESRTDYGWRGAWGRSSRSPQEPPKSAGEPVPGSIGGSVPDRGPDPSPQSTSSEPVAETAQIETAQIDPGPDETSGQPADEHELHQQDDQDESTEPDATDDRDDAVTEPAVAEVPESGIQESSIEESGIEESGAAEAEGESALAPPKSRPLPRVIALANQKGGVGKTTTTINLGAALAEDDHRVLIIDLDPQGNATTGLGINSRALDYSIYDVLLAEVPLEDCIESTSVRNLFIAPASLDLAGAEIELVPAMSREMRLRNAINRVKDDYDYILIDCPPSLGLLTVNALAAADEVMVPIQCEYYALEGLGQLIRNINLVQRNLNTALELSSIILVMYDGRTKLAEQVSTEVREHFGNLVCRNVIPRNIRLSEAPSYGQPITTFDPSSRGAVAYRELAREVHRVST